MRTRWKRRLIWHWRTCRKGKFAWSDPLAREAAEMDRKNEPDGWLRFRAESPLGAGLAGQKKYAEAEPLLVEGYRGMVARKSQIAVPHRDHLERPRMDRL